MLREVARTAPTLFEWSQLSLFEALSDGGESDPESLNGRNGRAEVESVGPILDAAELHYLLAVVLDLEVLGRLLSDATTKVKLKIEDVIRGKRINMNNINNQFF